MQGYLFDGNSPEDLEGWKSGNPIRECSAAELDDQRVVILDWPVAPPIPTGGTFREWLATQVGSGAQFPMCLSGLS